MSMIKGTAQANINLDNKQETTNGVTSQMVKNQFKNEGIDLSDADAEAFAKLSDSDRKTKIGLMKSQQNRDSYMNEEDVNAEAAEFVKNGQGQELADYKASYGSPNANATRAAVNKIEKENQQNTTGNGIQSDQNAVDNFKNRNKGEENSNAKDVDPEADAKRIMEQNGLNMKKYLKEDGSIDYRKLHRSMGWAKALAGIFGAIGSGFAGLGFRDGLSAEEAQKMIDNAGGRFKEVIDTQKGREEDKYTDDRQFKQYAKQLNLSTNEQASLMQLANTLQKNYQIDLWDHLKNMSPEDAKKIGQITRNMSGNSITGNAAGDMVVEILKGAGKVAATGLVAGATGGLGSDEGIKHFARRSMFK